jgi:hypothetical protein
MSREIPAVDVALFREIFDRWHDKLGQRTAIEIAEDDPVHEAMFVTAETVGLDDRESFEAIGTRLMALYTMLRRQKTKVLEIGGFPEEWVEKAATSRLEQLGEFGESDFMWPRESEEVSVSRAEP